MTLAEKIERIVATMLEGSDFTSASPGFINKTIQVGIAPAEDLEDDIEEIVNKTTTGRDNKETSEKVEELDLGNVGELQRMTNTQFGNIRQIATNPFAFFLGIFSRRVIRAASAVGFVFILFEIVKFIIGELMKPGRALDRAFKRLAANETFLFFTRQEQEKARRGFIDIRVTTTQGLRGGFGQVSGNLFVHGSPNYPQENRFSPVVEVLKFTSKGFATDTDGNPRGGHRTGGGPGA